MTIQLTPGTLITAGVDKPWYASQSMIVAALEKLGFQAIAWHDSVEGAPIERLTVNEGSWDTWLTGSYQGPAMNFEPPSQVKWVVLTPTVPNAIITEPESAPLVVIKNLVSSLEPRQVLGAVMIDFGVTLFIVKLVKGLKKNG